MIRFGLRWRSVGWGVLLACAPACGDGASNTPAMETLGDAPTDPSATASENAPRSTSTHQAARERETPSSGNAASAEAPEAESQAAVRGSSSAGCPSIVVDQRPPSNVRAEPKPWARQVGSLDSGTVVRIVGREGAWARIEEPVAGWIHAALVHEVCEVPTVRAGLRIEGRVFALLGEGNSVEDTGEPKAPRIGKVQGEDGPSPMTFFAEPTSQDVDALEVTSVPFDGGPSCQGKTMGPPVRLVGHCPGKWFQTWRAVEVDCPSSETWNFVVTGHWDHLSVSRWKRDPTTLTTEQKAAVLARGFILADPEIGVLVAPRSLTVVEIDIDNTVLLRSASIVATISTPQQSAPHRLAIDVLNYAIFETGYHGYRYVVVPTHRPERVSSLAFPATTCSTL